MQSFSESWPRPPTEDKTTEFIMEYDDLNELIFSTREDRMSLITQMDKLGGEKRRQQIKNRAIRSRFAPSIHHRSYRPGSTYYWICAFSHQLKNIKRKRIMISATSGAANADSKYLGMCKSENARFSFDVLELPPISTTSVKTTTARAQVEEFASQFSLPATVV